MKRLILIYLVACCSTAKSDDFPDRLMPVLKRHCLECHGPDEQHGGLRIDALTADFSDRDNAIHWVEVRNAIHLGEMPPEDKPGMELKDIQLLSDWIGRRIRESQKAALGSDGRVLLRRLNRHEYTSTISDLLQMQFPSGESPLVFLPPDGTAEGFDKVSAALLLDPSLMERYYQVARRIADRAIVDGPPVYPTEKMRLEFEDIAESRAIRYQTERLGMNPVAGGIELIEGGTRSFGLLNYPGQRNNNVAPTNGFYRFSLRAGGAAGENGELPRIRISHSHPDEKMQKILEVEVQAAWDDPQVYSVVLPRDTLGGEVKVSILNDTKLYMGQRPGEHFMQKINDVGKQGDFAESIRLTGRKIAEGWGGDRSTPDPDKLDRSRFPRVFLDYLEVEGPLYDQWPPKSHTNLMFKGSEAKQDMGYAREIFSRFLPRAWRRPVAEAEQEPILRVIRTELENGGTFHDAIRVGLTAALTSPKFLYLIESTPQTDPNRRLSDYELANRLSYFLWNSLPDDALFELASRRKLQDPDILVQQVDRMLDDPKSDRFIESFGRQWLRTETFTLFTPDQYLYREYDDDLAESVTQEPLEFFRTILREDRSVLNFLDSDFVVVNERLAQHYGLADVDGKQFRKVALGPTSHRGGLLGMAGVHQAGSDGVRTKPVARAVYVREVLFNNPPDPPPPNAGEIEPNIKGENLTVRERLLQHQQIESCAVCHRHLDPYGLALENFNVIGKWRELQDGENFRGKRRPEIVSSGRLPNGTEFSDFAGFRQLLLNQAPRFRLALAQKLFIYALGRPLEPTDDATLSQAAAEMVANGGTFRALIKSLVTSPGFQTK